MKALPVDVAPSVLRWARESIGMSLGEAAQRLNLFQSELELYELGEFSVPLSTLEKMADLYDRPLIAFFLEAPPVAEEPLPDFRLLPQNRDRPWPLELHKAYRRVLGQREVLIDLVEMEVEVRPPPIGLLLDIRSDPDTSAEMIREWLNVDRTREDPRTPSEVLAFWSSLVEAKGILVTQVPGIPIDQMRGFSIGLQPFPAIAINSRDTPRGKLFTLMHELVHVLLRRGGLCDLEDQYATSDTPNETVERYCNAVAAATLMPKSVLLQEAIVARADATTRWADSDIIRLADRCGVSEEAMLLRLVTLGKAPRELYQQRKPVFNSRYSRRREAGFGDPYRSRIRHLGRRFVTSVLRAYSQADISPSELSAHLNLRYKYIPELIKVLERDGG